MSNPCLGRWGKRWHTLLDEWIIVAAHRNNRPCSGDTVEKSDAHFHIELWTLLRKLNVLKHLAGPEIGGGNFLTVSVPAKKAAEKATELRGLSDVRFERGIGQVGNQ